MDLATQLTILRLLIATLVGILAGALIVYALHTFDKEDHNGR